MYQAITNSAVATVILTTCLFSRYLAELLAEAKIGPFVQVLPLCTRLVNQGLFPLPPGHYYFVCY